MLPSRKENSFETLPPPNRSGSDSKEYKVIRLQNGLVACLISEAYDTEKKRSENIEGNMAAAALSVGVGSFSDPKVMPGLAHFLEHMVFMGSSKYPAENDFDAFIKIRGGFDNASTGCETTVFYFECLGESLSKSLDRFAQFFIAPLMRKKSMKREKKAVDSEFQMAKSDDYNRKLQLLCSLADCDCPVNCFSFGNLVTLRDNVSDKKLHQYVHEFRRRHYSAHRMTLAIQARLPMEEIQRYVLECFSEVPSNNLPGDNFDCYKNNVYDTPKFSRLYYIEPQKDICRLDLTWCLPSLLDQYRTKPLQYVSRLISDQGEGSLHSYLKKKFLALSIYTGNAEMGYEHNSMYSLFSMSLVLTGEGLSHKEDVISAVFSYINMLKDVGPQERLFKELQIIEENSFEFSAEGSPMYYVVGISEAMHFYKSEDYITGPHLYFEYDPEAIKSVLECLVPEKMNIIVMSKNHEIEIEYDKKEKWFGTLYTDKEIPSEWISRWKTSKLEPEMYLPPPNPFVTTDFRIFSEEKNTIEYPEKIFGNSLVELWHTKDQKCIGPTALYRFYLKNPVWVESARSVCKMDMFMNLFMVQISEDIYPAEVAKLSCSISSKDQGIEFKVCGFNQNLPILVDIISHHLKMMKSQLTPVMFDDAKDNLYNIYYNNLIEPTALNENLELSLLMNKHFTLTEKIALISQITYKEMKKFCFKFLDKLYVKALVQGNVDKDTALMVIRKFVGDLNYTSLTNKLYPEFKVWKLPKGEKCCRVQSFNRNNSNSIVTNYYQIGPFSLRDCVILELIMMIIAEPLFDILRTKEQLGYNVFCTSWEEHGTLGYKITVNAQATKHTTAHVDERIENFITLTKQILNKMSKKKFNEVKRDSIAIKQCANLQDKVYWNWLEITGNSYMFDRLKREHLIKNTIEIDDLRKFWEDINISGNHKNYKKLTIQVVGFNINNEEVSSEKINEVCEESKKFLNNSAEEKPVLTFLWSDDKNAGAENYFIRDMTEFRKKRKYYPKLTNLFFLYS